jgi:hypothetical protein
MAGSKRRRGAGALWANVRDSEHPARHTLWLVFRNRTVAIATLNGCCGHPGEPGC